MAQSIAPLLALVVLSSLHEGPAHAYELKKRIDAGLGRFLRVADGSLYPLLHSLEAAGSIASRVEPADHGRPDRVVYSLTDAGLDELRSRMAAPLAKGAAGAVDFYVRVACFGCMDQASRSNLIAERRARVHGEIAALRQARERVANVPGHLELADLRERQLRVELAWLDDLERTL